MPTRPMFHLQHALLVVAALAAALALGACGSLGTKLQPPTAGIQQLTVNSNGTWTAVVRFQNYSYDTGMHVYAIDASLSLDGSPVGKVTLTPGLDIPQMDADIASATITPNAAGIAALAKAGHNAMRYELKGSLSVGKGDTGKAQPFKLDGKGYISPVPGVSNIWR